MASAPIRTSPMRCPRDGAELGPVRAADAADAAVERCRACGGLWLDAGELSRLAHGAALEEMATRAAGDETRRSPFACPRCGGACRATILERVEVDACAQCGGAWLDADELREARRQVLLQRVAQEERLRRLAASLAEAPAAPGA